MNPPSLRQWLATEGGAVPFRRYMEAALFDPCFGYYSRLISTVGRRGDFSTGASLSNRLARSIAAWVCHQRAAGVCHLIEIGPGTGQLHRELRKTLGWHGRRKLHSHLVERSPVLRAVQRRTLGLSAWATDWYDHPAAAVHASGGKALIFSNELVDAFPVTLLQKEEGGWKEVWLELAPGGGLVETLRTYSGGGTSTSLNPGNFAEGQRVEVHESYRQWLTEWLPHWQSGTMLTIDYGARVDSVYHRRPGGTLRGYLRHQRIDGLDIYRNPGQCDLTADVNFTDLEDWGTELGLTNTALETQSRFLNRHSSSITPADDWLADPAGPGGAFLCLHQKPGGFSSEPKIPGPVTGKYVP